MENKFPCGIELPCLHERVGYNIKELVVGPEDGSCLGQKEEQVQQLEQRAEAIVHGEQEG